MCLEEARILADDIHDIRSDYRFVVLSTLGLRQAEKLLDDENKEPLLGLLA